MEVDDGGATNGDTGEATNDSSSTDPAERVDAGAEMEILAMAFEDKATVYVSGAPWNGDCNNSGVENPPNSPSGIDTPLGTPVVKETLQQRLLRRFTQRTGRTLSTARVDEGSGSD